MDIINTKLISLLNSFTAQEIEQFRKFITSPFFTKGRNYIPYLEHILKLHPALNNRAHKINSKPHTGKKFSEQTLRNRYSELYKLGEEFLIHNGLSENKPERDKILLKKLMEKKLYVPLKIKYRETVNYLKKEKYNFANYNDLVVITEIYSWYLHDKNKLDALYNDYYEGSKIRLCLNLINLFEQGYEFIQQEFDSRKYEPNYILDFLKGLQIEKTMKSFSRSDIVLFKVTAMNYYLYKAFEDEKKEDHYLESHRIFNELFPDLKESYKVKIFNHMINFCIRKRNSGNMEYEYNLFDLYKEKLDQDLISDLKNNNYLFNYFRDYVLIGISIKEFEWVENFIAKYSMVLPQEIREDETKISYAKLNFAKRKFEKSLSYLTGIKKTYYLLYMDSSVLKLCIYFEQRKYEEAYLEIDRLKHYLRNHSEIPDVHVGTVTNFIRVYLTLLKYMTDPEKADVGFLEKELASFTLVSNRKWLLEKIGEIRD